MRKSGESERVEKRREMEWGKWREGQLEGEKIYLRATGVRILRGRIFLHVPRFTFSIPFQLLNYNIQLSSRSIFRIPYNFPCIIRTALPLAQNTVRRGPAANAWYREVALYTIKSEFSSYIPI